MTAAETILWRALRDRGYRRTILPASAGRDKWLHAQGWRILRCPNDIVISGTDIVVARIREAVAAVDPHPSRFA